MEYLSNPTFVVSVILIAGLPIIPLFFKNDATKITIEYLAFSATILATLFLYGKVTFLSVMLGYFSICTFAYFQLLFILLKLKDRKASAITLLAGYTAMASWWTTYLGITFVERIA